MKQLIVPIKMTSYNTNDQCYASIHFIIGKLKYLLFIEKFEPDLSQFNITLGTSVFNITHLYLDTLYVLVYSLMVLF